MNQSKKRKPWIRIKEGESKGKLTPNNPSKTIKNKKKCNINKRWDIELKNCVPKIANSLFGNNETSINKLLLSSPKILGLEQRERQELLNQNKIHRFLQNPLGFTNQIRKKIYKNQIAKVHYLNCKKKHEPPTTHEEFMKRMGGEVFNGNEIETTKKFDFEKEPLDSVLKILKKKKRGPEYGDLIEDCNESGYRSNGVYIIGQTLDAEGKEKLSVFPLDSEVDDYGHVGRNFSLGPPPNFPINYWDDANFKKAYWHTDPTPQPISWDVLSTIDFENANFTLNQKNNFEFTKPIIYKYYEDENDNEGEGEGDEVYNNQSKKGGIDVIFQWGILRFPGSLEEIIRKFRLLNDKALSEGDQYRIYFESSYERIPGKKKYIKVNRVEISEWDWDL